MTGSSSSQSSRYLEYSNLIRLVRHGLSYRKVFDMTHPLFFAEDSYYEELLEGVNKEGNGLTRKDLSLYVSYFMRDPEAHRHDRVAPCIRKMVEIIKLPLDELRDIVQYVIFYCHGVKAALAMRVKFTPDILNIQLPPAKSESLRESMVASIVYIIRKNGYTSEDILTTKSPYLQCKEVQKILNLRIDNPKQKQKPHEFLEMANKVYSYIVNAGEDWEIDFDEYFERIKNRRKCNLALLNLMKNKDKLDENSKSFLDNPEIFYEVLSRTLSLYKNANKALYWRVSDLIDTYNVSE